MSEPNRYDQLLAKATAEFPSLRVRKRSSTWLGPVMRLLGFVTQRGNYASFITTIGSTLYVPDNWDQGTANDRYAILRHELVHVRQFHYWPLGPGGQWRRRLNHFLMGFAYLFLMPVFWTLRAQFEREGYTQTLLVAYELHGRPTTMMMEAKADWLAGIFGGSAYLWMWSKKNAWAWTMATQKKINAGLLWNVRDRCD